MVEKVKGFFSSQEPLNKQDDLEDPRKAFTGVEVRLWPLEEGFAFGDNHISPVRIRSPADHNAIMLDHRTRSTAAF